jgi:hypothetical protein
LVRFSPRPLPPPINKEKKGEDNEEIKKEQHCENFKKYRQTEHGTGMG